MIEQRWRHFRCWHEAALLLLLLGVCGAASAAMPRFLDLNSQLVLSKQLWETAILALGMTLIVISGGIDLSVGSAMGLCAVTFGICHARTGNLWLSGLTCLATGGLGGAFNGLLVSRARIHPLIVTLATYAAFRGLAEGISQGASYSRFGTSFSQVARGACCGVPWPGVVFGVLALTFAVVLAKTAFGRCLYALGHNETATRFSGIAVDEIKFRLYTLSGLLAGLATIIYLSRFDTAKADAGMGLELEVITAVVIGGTSIFGGRGNVFGTVLGLLLVHETNLFVGRYWQITELKSIMIGALLIASILVYRVIAPKADEAL